MSFTCFLAWVAIIVTLPLIILFRITETQTQTIRRQRRNGWTLKRIANYHGISASTVRRRLA